ncbi:MAG: CHAT domain-containing protein [Actinomycetota bacterium]|nr:CHAT domain-containing protein [Actinomycetota bacterium]
MADRSLAIVRIGAHILAEEGSPDEVLRQVLEATFDHPALAGLARLTCLAIDLAGTEGAADGVSAAREAEQLIGRPTDWRLQVFTCLVLSEVHERAGHLVRSRDYLLDLMSALDRAPDDQEIVAVRMDCGLRLGRVALSVGDLGEARSNLEAVCRIDIDGPAADRLRSAAQRLLSVSSVVDPHAYSRGPVPDADHSDEDDFELLLLEGSGLLQDGSRRAAKNCARRLLREAGAAQARRHEVSAYWLLADIAAQRGRLGSARKYLKKAVDRATLASDALLVCRTEMIQAELHLENRRFRAARKHAARALEHSTEDSTVRSRFDAHVAYARSLADGPEPDVGMALTHALKAVSLRSWMRTHHGDFELPQLMDASIFNLDELALRLAAAAGDGLAGFHIMEQGRSESMSAMLTDNLAAGETGTGTSLSDTVTSLNAARSLRRSVEFRFEGSGPGVSLASRIRWKLEREAILAHEARLERQLADELGKSARLVLDGEDTKHPDRAPELPENSHLLYIQIRTDPVHAASVYFVWLPGNGAPEIDSVPLDSGQVALLSVLTTSLPRDYPMEESRRKIMSSEADPCWDELVDVLLPRRLKELLVAAHDRADHEQPSLTIVPFYYLWRFPFAALRVRADPDVRLIDCANIALTPSSRFLRLESGPPIESPRECGPTRRALGYLPTLTAESQVALERDALNAAYTFTEANSADNLLTFLRSGDDYALVTVSVHGDDEPTFSHGLHLDATHTLTAADLLGLRMPRHLVLGACSSGAIEANSGEPIGLATMAFVRGATTVTAAPLSIPDAATAAVLAGLYPQLAAGTRPALALRRAQQHVRAQPETHAPVFWAGLTTISRDLP